jgi:FAD:protein FMN transferase
MTTALLPHYTAVTVVVFFSLICGLIEKAQAEEFSFYHENVLGSSMELVITALSENDAHLAEEAALKEIDRLNAILSSYDPESSLSKFLQAPVNTDRYLPGELIELLVASGWWNIKTGGAFNPVAEELSLLWKSHARANTLPNQAEISEYLKKVNQPAGRSILPMKLCSDSRTSISVLTP